MFKVIKIQDWVTIINIYKYLCEIYEIESIRIMKVIYINKLIWIFKKYELFVYNIY